MPSSAEETIQRLTRLNISSEAEVISNLIDLSRILDAYNVIKRNEMLNKIASTNIPTLICASLKQDLAKFQRTWNSALELSCFIRKIIDVTSDNIKSKEILMNFIESHLVLLRRVQKQFLFSAKKSTPADPSKVDLIQTITNILSNIHSLMERFPDILPYEMISSTWFSSVICDGRRSADNDVYSVVESVHGTVPDGIREVEESSER